MDVSSPGLQTGAILVQNFGPDSNMDVSSPGLQTGAILVQNFGPDSNMDVSSPGLQTGENCGLIGSVWETFPAFVSRLLSSRVHLSRFK